MIAGEAFSLSKTDQQDMNFAMRLSFLVGIFMLLIKTYAYYITGSTAILSDAAESVIHIFAVGFAAYSMWLSLKPPDENHLYGHDKVNFFSAGFEGALIIIAAIFIIYESSIKILFGFEIESVNEGIFLIIASVLINAALSFYLIRKGEKHHSLILEANGKHILTDCLTSLGVITALILVKFTGITLFDPVIAIFMAINILWTGSKLVKKSISGLMDQIEPDLHRQILENIQRETKQKELEFHHLRHRFSGNKVFIEFHLLFPKNIMLQEAHDVSSEIEANMKKLLRVPSEIFIHIEPQENHDQIHKKYGLLI